MERPFIHQRPLRCDMSIAVRTPVEAEWSHLSTVNAPSVHYYARVQQGRERAIYFEHSTSRPRFQTGVSQEVVDSYIISIISGTHLWCFRLFLLSLLLLQIQLLVEPKLA